MGICESNESQTAVPLEDKTIAKKPTAPAQPLTVHGNYLNADFRTIVTMMQLAETKIEIKNVDNLSGDHMKDAYLAVNPLGLVPTIVENNNRVFGHSSVFVNYLN